MARRAAMPHLHRGRFSTVRHLKGTALGPAAVDLAEEFSRDCPCPAELLPAPDCRAPAAGVSGHVKRVNAAARTAVVCWDPVPDGTPAEEREVSCYALRVRAMLILFPRLCP